MAKPGMVGGATKDFSCERRERADFWVDKRENPYLVRYRPMYQARLAPGEVALVGRTRQVGEQSWRFPRHRIRRDHVSPTLRILQF